ncbi:uncharacterized protein METZ01_LOCUS318920 [marine metagenome]|uniref:Uncharacterized protein n=1 Tax=marine metagenome TaxID=408172 RepID=A0A382NYB8_9ZZZZ
MKTIITNILVLLGGCVSGSVVNMGLIIAGNQLIPMADGMNPMDATMWEIRYFIFPFLAHAIGTLSGAFIVAKYTVSYHMILAICIGIFFLLSGISMVFIMPAPVWFIVADLSLAYIPMGWYGWKLTGQDK